MGSRSFAPSSVLPCSIGPEGGQAVLDGADPILVGTELVLVGQPWPRHGLRLFFFLDRKSVV